MSDSDEGAFLIIAFLLIVLLFIIGAIYELLKYIVDYLSRHPTLSEISDLLGTIFLVFVLPGLIVWHDIRKKKMEREMYIRFEFCLRLDTPIKIEEKDLKEHLNGESCFLVTDPKIFEDAEGREVYKILL